MGPFWITWDPEIFRNVALVSFSKRVITVGYANCFAGVVRVSDDLTHPLSLLSEFSLWGRVAAFSGLIGLLCQPLLVGRVYPHYQLIRI